LPLKPFGHRHGSTKAFSAPRDHADYDGIGVGDVDQGLARLLDAAHVLVSNTAPVGSYLCTRIEIEVVRTRVPDRVTREGAISRETVTPSFAITPTLQPGQVCVLRYV
jgi:hypothetical protein